MKYHSPTLLAPQPALTCCHVLHKYICKYSQAYIDSDYSKDIYICLRGLIDHMFELIDSLISNYGYLSLFLTSFLASTVLPFGSEGIVILLIHSGFNLFTVVMVATVGNYLGACTTYYIGLKGRTGIIDKYLSISQDQLTRTDQLFEKYGVYILLFTWVPGIGDAITAAGGLLKLPFKTFSIYVFAGKFARYLAIAYLTTKL